MQLEQEKGLMLLLKKQLLPLRPFLPQPQLQKLLMHPTQRMSAMHRQQLQQQHDQHQRQQQLLRMDRAHHFESSWTKPRANRHSQYAGATWRKLIGKWEAQRQQRSIGFFESQEDAALAFFIETSKTMGGHQQPFGAMGSPPAMSGAGGSQQQPSRAMGGHQQPFGAMGSLQQPFGAMGSPPAMSGAGGSLQQPSRAMGSHQQPFGAMGTERKRVEREEREEVERARAENRPPLSQTQRSNAVLRQAHKAREAADRLQQQQLVQNQQQQQQRDLAIQLCLFRQLHQQQGGSQQQPSGAMGSLLQPSRAMGSP